MLVLLLELANGLILPVNDPDGYARREEVSHTVETRQQKGRVMVHSHGLLEDDCCVLFLNKHK